MKQEEKNKRVLEIADELQKLGYPEVASKLREAVTSGKTKTNESTDEDPGGSNPGGKPKPDKP